jgi:hypothetical protein
MEVRSSRTRLVVKKTDRSSVIPQHTLCDDNGGGTNVENFIGTNNEIIHKNPAAPISTVRGGNTTLFKHVAFSLHTIHTHGDNHRIH